MVMFKRNLGFKPLVLFLLLGCFIVPVSAQDAAPANLQVALLMKLLGFYTNLGDKPFTIHIVGAPEIAKEFKGQIGKAAGKATLNAVTEGDAPTDGAQVVYIGKDAASVIKWTQGKKALSVTGIPSFVNDGVTLGIGVEGGKPKILLNLSSSKAEDINWNPAILKVAATIN